MRVTENLIVRNFLARSARTLSDMAWWQERIASGRKVLRPSDDPQDLQKILALRTDIRLTEAYRDNASSATAHMSLTESSLQEISDLLSRAKEIVLEGMNAPSEGVGTEALVRDLRAMIEELLLIANRSVGGRYLFAGQQTRSPAYVQHGGRLVYQGDMGDIVEELGPGLRVVINLTGPGAFQTVPSRILGSVDLDPSVSRITELADLFGGRGVTPGHIRITDSNDVSATLDLMSATNLGQVVDAINNAGTAIVASFSADGSTIELTDTGGGSSFRVEDAVDGNFARALGLATTSETGTITGVDLDPAVTENTAIALLLRGAGLPPGTWSVRNNADGEERLAVIDPTEANTVGDLIDMLNTARTPDGRDLGIRATLEDAYLSLRSTRLHTSLSVSDDGAGTSAMELGIAGVGEARDLFQLLEDAADALEGRDADRIDSMIEALTTAIERTAGVRGTYGARARQVLAVAANLDDQTVDLTIRLSDVEDTDLALAVLQLRKAETVYNASLASGTQLLGVNLFNYIR